MWYPVFLKTEVGMTASMAGLVAGLWGVGQFIGRPTMGHISDRLGYRKVGITGGIIMGFVSCSSSRSTTLSPGVPSPFHRFCGLCRDGIALDLHGSHLRPHPGLALGVLTTWSYAIASLSP
jgi:MFS family permease